MELTQRARPVSMPTGTVTFLFTDIEGSTKLLQRLGDDFADLLAVHHRILRAAVNAHNGYEVDTAGDGFFVVFAEPTQAVRAALAAQLEFADTSWPQGEQVRVRMGIHTGEVQVSGDNYVGMSIHQAARISAAGNGGQVLVSEATQALIHEPTLTFRDLGYFELKDLGRPIRLMQLTHPKLPEVFAPIRALSDRKNNLPVIRTTFVGRRQDVEDLLELLGRPGLVTLTGPGGCGKTRLAVETAHGALDTLAGGCWFVDLRAADDLASASEALAAALGVGEAEGQAASELVFTRLNQAPALVILDNCEHLIEACADLADELLRRCPELRIIATSRDLLGIGEEIARRVPSLPVPLEGATAEEALGFAAVELFAERARRVAPRFVVDESTVADVVSICRRLDGIPLAIELAAARLRHMKVESLVSRLDDMFRILVGSDRRSLQRHQTLEAVVGWSHDLLGEEEQTLLRRLSVFMGSFSLEAAEGVCGDPPLDPERIPELLFSLVDRSMVETESDQDRYRLLETIRQFAQARLVEAQEGEQVRARHLETFAHLAEQVGPFSEREMSLESLAYAEPDADNIKTAFEWAVEKGARDLALTIAACTPWLFAILGRPNDAARFSEGIDRLRGEDAARGRAEVGFAFGMVMSGSSRSSSAEAGLALLQKHAEVEDPWALLALITVAAGEAGSGDPRKALEYSTKAEEALGDRDLPWIRTQLWAGRAWGLFREGEPDRALKSLARALEFARATKNELWIGTALFWSGLMSIHTGDHEAARRYYAEGIPLYRKLPYKMWLQWELDHIAHACYNLGDLTAARAYAEEALTLSRESGLTGRGNYRSLLQTLGRVETELGDHEQAAWYFERALQAEDPEDTVHSRVVSLALLASAECRLDRPGAAAAHMDTALKLLRDLEPVALPSGVTQHPPVGSAAQATAWLALLMGDHRGAAVLSGAAEGWRRRTAQGQLLERLRKDLEKRIEPARKSLGADFDLAWSEGLDLPDDKILDAAAAVVHRAASGHN